MKMHFQKIIDIIFKHCVYTLITFRYCGHITETIKHGKLIFTRGFRGFSLILHYLVPCIGQNIMVGEHTQRTTCQAIDDQERRGQHRRWTKQTYP